METLIKPSFRVSALLANYPVRSLDYNGLSKYTNIFRGEKKRFQDCRSDSQHFFPISLVLLSDIADFSIQNYFVVT